MRIVKLATEFPFKCTKCACEFLFEKTDVRKGQFFDAITCPNCNEDTGKEHLDMAKGEVWTYVYESRLNDRASHLNRVIIVARNLKDVTEDPSIIRKGSYDVSFSYSLHHKKVYPGRDGRMYIEFGKLYDYGISAPLIEFDSSKF